MSAAGRSRHATVLVSCRRELTFDCSQEARVKNSQPHPGNEPPGAIGAPHSGLPVRTVTRLRKASLCELLHICLGKNFVVSPMQKTHNAQTHRPCDAAAIVRQN